MPGSDKMTAQNKQIVNRSMSTQVGLPQVGLPQVGLPQVGLPQDGLPQDGLPQDGLPQLRRMCVASADPQNEFLSGSQG